MTYTVTWTGVEGPTRRTGLTAAEAVAWHKSYSLVSADFLIEDEAGSPVAVEDLKKLAEGQ